jgi:hypothetical protein
MSAPARAAVPTDEDAATQQFSGWQISYVVSYDCKIRLHLCT